MSAHSFNGIFKAVRGKRTDYALLGAPYDAASSYRPGARLAPTAIRELAKSLNTCTERGHDLVNLNAADAGDLILPPCARNSHESLKTEVGRWLARGAVPIVLGGDHSVTVPCFEAVWQRHPDAQLLYFDAHPDLYADYEGDPFSHACVVSRILELDGMSGARITQVGIRASTPAQQATARRSGVRTVHAWEVDGFVYESALPVYISFDIDVLDPAHAPGCGNPVPGGLSTRQAFDLLRAVRAPVVGVDVVEVNPLLDPHGITALAAARVVIETLGVITGPTA